MSAYTNQKDFFTADSGFWTNKTTGVTISFSGGDKVFDKTADSWSSGHHFGALHAIAKGDGIIYKFKFDELNSGDTYHLIALSGNATPDYSASGYGVYIYPDGGVRAHGQDGGGITSTLTNPAGTFSLGDELQVRFTVDPTTGFCDVDLMGGPFMTWTNVVLGGADISAGNGSGYFAGGAKLFHGMYSANSGCSVHEYQWYDSGGPDVESDIIFEDTFADESHITEVVPGVATVTNSSNTEVISLSDGTVVSEGFYGNDTVTVDEEDSLSFSLKFNATPCYANVGAGDSMGLTGNYDVINVPQGLFLQATLHGSNFGDPVAALANTRYYFRLMFGSERQALYYNDTGYSHDLADYNLLSGVIDGVADVARAMRFLAFVTGGTNGSAVTIYPYQFRDNSQLVIANAPIPTNLTATALTLNSIRVGWTDNGAADTETSIKIERSTTGGGVGFSEIASVPLGSTGYVDSGLAPQTKYFYRVRSDFSFGAIHHYSSYTSEDDATTNVNAGALSGVIPSFLNRRRRR